MNVPIRRWTGGLGMEKAKLMASTAPRREWDPIKRDHKPTYRFASSSTILTSNQIHSRHLTESLVMERVRHMGSTARRRVWDQTKQDLRRTFRCLLLRTFHLNVNCLFSLLGEQRERVRLKTGKRIICEINWKDLHRQRYKLKLSDKTQVQCKRGCYKTGSSKTKNKYPGFLFVPS